MSSAPPVEAASLWPQTESPSAAPPPQAERQRIEMLVLQAVQAQPWFMWLIAAMGAWVLSSVVM